MDIQSYEIQVGEDGQFYVNLDEGDTVFLGWRRYQSFDEAIREIRAHWYAETEGVSPPKLD